jgi:hypothetical protein
MCGSRTIYYLESTKWKQCQDVESNHFLVNGTICLNSKTTPRVLIEETYHFIRFRKSYAVSLLRKKFKRQLKPRRNEAVINLKKENLVDQHSSEFVNQNAKNKHSIMTPT